MKLRVAWEAISRAIWSSAGLLFAAIVFFPASTIALYLVLFAADQYHSQAGFSVRSEQGGSGVAQGFLGVLSTVSGTGSAQDLDLLNDYIRSQAIVEKVNETVDLRKIFALRGRDWFFALRRDAPMEDLVAYWRRMVRVSNEGRDGILHIEVRAFDPRDAQLVVEAILQASSDLINQLSNEARNDSLRLSGELVTEARANVQQVLQELTDFRRKHQLVSPELEAQTSIGVITALQTQLAEALVARGQLIMSSSEQDPRTQNIDTRISSLRSQIEAERIALSQSDLTADVDIYGRYQSLLLEQEMMSTAYAQAIAGLANAHTEARRQARYVAVHIPPALAEMPLYPERLRIIFISTILLILIWALVVIFYRNARDKF